MRNVRTDIHRPSAIKVEDYFSIGYIYLAAPDYQSPDFAIWNGEEKQRIWDLVRKNGWHWSRHDHGGTCGICGASANYVGVFVHQPTGEVIYVGHQCADKVEMGDSDAFDALKQRIHAAQKRYRAVLTARKLLHEYGIPELECGQYFHNILADMWGQLVRWGVLTEKQIGLAKKLISEAKKGTKGEFPKEPEPTKKAPEGRVAVTGEILGIKQVDSPTYGPSIKMLVRADDGGWKVWLTRPRSLNAAEKGSRVEFTANLKRSDKDEYFAYGSRPTKGRLFDPAEAHV